MWDLSSEIGHHSGKLDARAQGTIQLSWKIIFTTISTLCFALSDKNIFQNKTLSWAFS